MNAASKDHLVVWDGDSIRPIPVSEALPGIESGRFQDCKTADSRYFLTKKQLIERERDFKDDRAQLKLPFDEPAKKSAAKPVTVQRRGGTYVTPENPTGSGDSLFYETKPMTAAPEEKQDPKPAPAPAPAPAPSPPEPNITPTPPTPPTPPAAAAFAEDASAEVDPKWGLKADGTPKRRPGRPKGKKNKPKADS